MEREVLEPYVLQNMSVRQISKELGMGSSTIAYWLRKHHLKTDPYRKGTNEYTMETGVGSCEICGKVSKENRRICNTCHVKMVRFRQKIALTIYRGGKCSVCGYDKNLSALEFHHREAKDKDFTLSEGVKSWKTMIIESEKCDLLCSNCHQELHSNGYWKELYAFAVDYRGNNEHLKSLLKTSRPCIRTVS